MNQPAAVPNKSWRAAWIVVAVCLALSALIGIRLKTLYSPQLTRTQDVVTGLLYFMESNEGRFPANEAEFRASSFVETLPSGALKIRPKPGTLFRKNPHGAEIARLGEFKIAWGADLASIQVDGRGVPRGADGKKIELVSWEASPPSGKTYTQILLHGFRQLKPAAASAPASTMAPATAPALP